MLASISPQWFVFRIKNGRSAGRRVYEAVAPIWSLGKSCQRDFDRSRRGNL